MSQLVQWGGTRAAASSGSAVAGVGAVSEPKAKVGFGGGAAASSPAKKGGAAKKKKSKRK